MFSSHALMFELCQVLLPENREKSVAGEAGFLGSMTVLPDAGIGRAATTVKQIISLLTWTFF